ncbi:conserved hypothetical protein [Pseudarthrobacter chlorophenolicus A6]|uniref:Uncharacterized protein n=1 Tax=Pseudarthrobacter chlorophenolicus (strain ATCC 700700 / DSM 12829 / CIP 107037 / JCM 12360 / KCTC 9906 / NCIMB 13794 / A6) TaxID=452863 RepID=B8H6I7_PSECP|nr:conserved hypothetical protein [Pseudarthrobacter chlorophenolicus A6]SDQ62850.1 hypothetical protein SAMN04489738_1920 [Pseudarthrobacter chlorophenolicus]
MARHTKESGLKRASTLNYRLAPQGPRTWRVGRSIRVRWGFAAALSSVALIAAGCSSPPSPPDGGSSSGEGGYPWHTNIVATTFWVGELFDPKADDGSQVMSTYDSGWMRNFGGCDGVMKSGTCETEQRTEANRYMPTGMTPKENPFYLDLPYDDVNDSKAFAERATVIPWAKDPEYAGREQDKSFSYMKNQWVRIRKGNQECYGQIQDAGPGQYHDKEYVFGSNDARPANKEFNGAGMDVSPALNGCLDFEDINGESDTVDWQFVTRDQVPAGPWLDIVTTSQVR